MFVQYITTIQINLRIYQRETNIFLSYQVLLLLIVYSMQIAKTQVQYLISNKSIRLLNSFDDLNIYRINIIIN